MDQPRHLRDDCLSALENYAREARKTCELLGEIGLTRASAERLLPILAQAEVERDSKEFYLSVRQCLCEAAMNALEVPGPTRTSAFAGERPDQRSLVQSP